jgi:hypothetical protein
MRKVSILLALGYLASSALAFAAGNTSPCLVLTIYTNTADEPPATSCIARSSTVFQDILDCYAPKPAPGSYGFLSVHVGRLENGFTGIPFGIEATGSAVTFLGFVPCPGFTVVLSEPGMPSAIMVTSTEGCRQAREADGYLTYLCSSVSATYFNIVANADMGHYKVINCDYTFDEGTSNSGYAQWGGTQTVVCPYLWLATEPVTWGKIKTLYR